MKTFNSRTAFSVVIAALAVMGTAPANAAGGRSGAQASAETHRAQLAAQQSQAQIQMQAEIEALRKDMLELKERQAVLKVSATAK